jgi:hypothetical protein
VIGPLVTMVWIAYIVAWNPWAPRGPSASPELQWFLRALGALFVIGMAIGMVIQLRRAIRRLPAG